MAAMRRHTDSVDVQIAGCRAFVSLSGHTARQTAIVRAGGVDVLLSAMRCHEGQ
jgi:hypothetical protein